VSQTVFGQEYSALYDALYEDKDYDAEVALLKAVFDRYATRPVHSILDMGCGTGGHALPLAQIGYHVTGVDRSEGMLQLARQKSDDFRGQPNFLAPTFLCADLQNLDLGKQFDAVIMMFAVMGYQYSNDEVLKALSAVRHHLAPGGIFIFDVWYGPTVLTIRPGDRVKQVNLGETRILRSASGSLDTLHHLAEVRYHLWQFQGDRIMSETEEAHQMRYFFPQELNLFCRQAGLELVSLSEFGELEHSPTEQTWNVMGVARLE
jgi:SAM-dependent methyltransferase